jgi:hypothetical protein
MARSKKKKQLLKSKKSLSKTRKLVIKNEEILRKLKDHHGQEDTQV